MITSKSELLKEALELSPIERAELLEEIISSFNPKIDEKINMIWADESEKRIDSFDNGKISSVSASKVFSKL